MKIIEDTEVPGDPRQRSYNNTARVDIVVYLDVPDAELARLSSPGRKVLAIDVAREKIAGASSVGQLVQRLDRFSTGAIVRASGR